MASWQLLPLLFVSAGLRSPIKMATAIHTQMKAAMVAGVRCSPSRVIAITICTLGERNWMKLTASKGRRRIESVKVRSRHNGDNAR